MRRGAGPALIMLLRRKRGPAAHVGVLPDWKPLAVAVAAPLKDWYQLSVGQIPDSGRVQRRRWKVAAHVGGLPWG